ncbi:MULTISPECIES: DnaD domain-containing protein [unclassified Paenibacillus]|uniref:DnaD domain-containing protein n=1 Tax=unclassified Paenibacillus TaxID=185978 RepID=UPI0010523FC8|nr:MULTISPECIES: DnaD domain-containing protein [unclassified Paenibacillus]NIK67764.1 DNA replication protein [Paenibacillus sp. BK720]TCN01805.1 DNA replication protein DnaD [Paenibacillus sp. BK033]
MSNEDMWKAYSRGMAAVMKEGGVHVSALLLRSYRQLNLSDTEAMLLLQLMLFGEAEGVEFPTMEQLAERTGSTTRDIEQTIGRLMKEGFLTIDERIDPVTGIQSEQYNWSGWLLKAAEWAAEEKRETRRTERRTVKRATDPGNIFSVFEQEFGRLLSPMECETISGWLDQDRYADELIRFALKEAVFAGKLNFRYIDRILIEWGRNRVTNVDEARAHSQKFRGPRG